MLLWINHLAFLEEVAEAGLDKLHAGFGVLDLLVRARTKMMPRRDDLALMVSDMKMLILVLRHRALGIRIIMSVMRCRLHF